MIVPRSSNAELTIAIILSNHCLKPRPIASSEHNRAAHHHAVWDYYPQERHGERVTVKAAAAPQA